MNLEEALAKAIKILIKHSNDMKSFNEGVLNLSLTSTHPLWDDGNVTEVLKVGIDIVPLADNDFELEARSIQKKLCNGDVLLASKTVIIE
jgi:hypothetical protein